MCDVDMILERMGKMLIALGFSEVNIGGNLNYMLGDTYCIPQHIKPLGFFMEYAHSREEAAKNWHGDGDKFSPTMAEDAIIAAIKAEVLRSTPELRQEKTPLPLAV